MPNQHWPHVLIIDDDDIVRGVTQQIVQRSGFPALLAGSGREGVRLLAEHQGKIGCVLLDMSMPGMDGAETFTALREVVSDVCVIVISGYSADDLNDSFRAARPFAFIQKPFTISELDATLRSAVGIAAPKVETSPQAARPGRVVLRTSTAH